ncbi:RING finger protein 17-like [Tubulanus polymorphus]|uniref:RING finger protein 17-like n=1 Tax=Tubulanus polymorphus TaxID=672921 RepID=UPI003DA53AA8
MHKAMYCATCNQIFSAKDGYHRDTQKVPLMLKCGHTYCEACLRKLIKLKKTSISCPACQTLTPVQDGDIKNLPYDIYLLGLTVSKQRTIPLELLKFQPIVTKRKQPSVSPGGASGLDHFREDPCSECAVNEATVSCLKCECNMCRKCFDKVHEAKILRKHQPILLNKNEMAYRFFSSHASDGPMACEPHNNRPFEYYCEDDHVAICSRCVIVGDHKGHAITPLEEKNQAVIGELVPAMKKAAIIKSTLQKSRKHLSGHFPDLKTDIQKRISDVRYHFHRCHSLLQAREQALIEDIQNTVQLVTEPVSQLKTEIEENISKIEYLLKEGQILRNSNAEILNGQGILDRLEATTALPCVLVASDCKEINFGCKYDDDFEKLIKEYGQVVLSADLPSFKLAQLLDMPDVNSVDVDMFELDSVDADSGASPSVSVPSYSTHSSDVVIEEDIIDLVSNASSHTLSRTNSVDGNTMHENLRSLEEPIAIPKKSHLEKSSCEQVVVTHIKNPCHFVIQLLRDARRLSKLSRDINKYAAGAKKRERVKDVNIGDLVLASFTQDDQWYRARVISTLQELSDTIPAGSVEVVYFDFGNKEFVPLERIIAMPKKYMRDPEYGILCSLVDIVPAEKSTKWSQEAIDTFDKMTGSNSTMILTVHSYENNLLYIDLSKPPNDDIPDDRPVSVRDALVFMELACFTSEHSISSVPALAEKRFFAPTLPKPNSEVLGKISYCFSPSTFFIQRRGDYASYFKDINISLQNTYKSDKGELWSIFCPRKDMACIVRNPDDGRWYRAHVMRMLGKRMIDVELIDIGCNKLITVWDVKKVLPKFMILEAQALPCRLADIQPLSGKQWSDECIEKMKELMFSKELVFEVKELNKSQLSVLAFEVQDGNRISINAQLVRLGYALSTGLGSVTQSTLPPSPGKTNKSEEKTAEIADLAVVKVSWADLSELAEAHKQGTTETVGPPGSYPKEGKQVTKKSSPVKCEESESETSSDETTSNAYSLHVTHVVSPDEIFMQNASDSSLESLMKQLKEMYENSPTLNMKWEVDDVCAVCYSRDNKWYRAKVKEVYEDDTSKVHLMDYGYSDILPQTAMRLLDEKFIQPYPCFALQCRLYGIQPAGDISRWSRTACDILKDTVLGKQCQIIKKGDMVDGILPVDIRIHEVVEADALNAEKCNIVSGIDILISHGVALPIKGQRSSLNNGESGQNSSEDVEINDISKVPKKERLMRRLPIVKYLPPKMPKSPQMKGMPTYVDYSGIIMVQDMNDSDIINSLMGDLQRTFYNSEPEEDVLWEVGNGCTARYHVDNSWYRAKILALNPERGIQVLYIDFGNSEFVSRDQLRCEAVHLDIPQQCLEMKLHQIAPKSSTGTWPVPVLDHMHNVIVGQPCDIVIVEQPEAGKPIEVMLETRKGLNLAELLLKENMVVSLTEYPEPEVIIEEENLPTIPTITDISSQNLNGAVSSTYKTVSMPNLHEYFCVSVTSTIDVNLVCCQFSRFENTDDERQIQINAQLDALLQLSHEINEIAPDAPPVDEPELGMACLGQFSYDNCWYRAEIMSMNAAKRTCDVRYVDYGNAETVDFSNLREIYSEYLELPAQGLHFIIDGITPPTGVGWPEETLKLMDATLASGNLIACITDNSSTPKVQLYSDIPQPGCELPLVYQPLVDSGLVKLN